MNGLPLLATKLTIPPAPASRVPRTALLERLNRGLGGKVTLLSAPAGFGKTSLLSQWVRSLDQPCGWLSLEEEDNPPSSFLAYFTAALHKALPKNRVIARLRNGNLQQSNLQEAMAILINSLAGERRKCILVLDDFHHLTEPSVLESLHYLVEHQPGQLHLVLSSRAEPSMPLARLRGQGQLSELRAADLRFSTEETGTLLRNRMGLKLTDEEIETLNNRSEGWATGLQMAAVALQGSPDPAAFIQQFTGSQHYILDYLLEEVLERQPEDIQQFLLATSVLRRMCGPLCEALCRTINGQAMLDQLERSNLFINPIDEERRWFRYHQLFKDLLLRRLQESQPEHVAGYRLSAAEWLAENNLLGEAIDLALEAGDLGKAMEWIERAAPELLYNSQAGDLLRWIKALPRSLREGRPRLNGQMAIALMFTGAPVEAIRDCMALINGNDGTSLGIRHLLEGYLHLMQADHRQAGNAILEGMEELPEEEVFFRGLGVWLLGTAETIGADLMEGIEALENVHANPAVQNAPIVLALTMVQLGGLYYRQGKLSQALKTMERGLAHARDGKGNLLPIASRALLGIGEIQRERNQLEEAEKTFQEALEVGSPLEKTNLLNANISLARIAAARGEKKQAMGYLQEAREAARAITVTDIDDLLVDSLEARILLERQDLQAVERWAVRRGLLAANGSLQKFEGSRLTEKRMYKYDAAVLGRYLNAKREFAATLELTQPLVEELTAQGRMALAMEIHMLQACAWQGLGETGTALESMNKAMAIAEPEGFSRLFLDEGEEMQVLLERLGHSKKEGSKYAARLAAQFGSAVETEAKPGKEIARLIEPLSVRELEVLHLLGSELTIGEIAARLYVAESTVRSHVKSIYAKLGVHNRQQAVARGKELGEGSF